MTHGGVISAWRKRIRYSGASITGPAGMRTSKNMSKSVRGYAQTGLSRALPSSVFPLLFLPVIIDYCCPHNAAGLIMLLLDFLNCLYGTLSPVASVFLLFIP